MAARGRPFEPGNNVGRGRPKGSRNKVSQEARQILEQYKEPLMRKVISRGLQGEPRTLNNLVNKLLGSAAHPVKLGKLSMNTTDDLIKVSELVVNKLVAREITIDEAQVLAGLIEQRRKLIETNEHEKRMSALENAAEAIDETPDEEAA